MERLCQGDVARQHATPASCVTQGGLSPILRRLDHHPTVGHRLERMASRLHEQNQLTLTRPQQRARLNPPQHSLLRRFSDNARPVAVSRLGDGFVGVKAVRPSRPMLQIALPAIEPKHPSCVGVVKGSVVSEAAQHRRRCARVSLPEGMGAFGAALSGSRPPAAQLDNVSPAEDAGCAGTPAASRCGSTPGCLGEPPTGTQEPCVAVPAHSDFNALKPGSAGHEPEQTRVRESNPGQHNTADLVSTARRSSDEEARSGPCSGVDPPAFGATPGRPPDHAIGAGPGYRVSAAPGTRSVEVWPSDHHINALTLNPRPSSAPTPPRWWRRCQALHDITRPRRQARAIAQCGDASVTTLGRTRVTSGRLG